MKHAEEIKNILFEAVWEYWSGVSHCKGCGIYKYNGEPHDEYCVYGELLRIVDKHDNLITLCQDIAIANSHIESCDMPEWLEEVKQVILEEE